MASFDSVGFEGPSEEYQVGVGSLRDQRTINSPTVSGYHDINLLDSLLKNILLETNQLISDAERILSNYNLIINDPQLKAAQESEWPAEQLGVPKDFISYDQYKALKTADTRGSAYITKIYNEKIRGPSGTNAIDIINIMGSVHQEAQHIRDFIDDAISNISDPAEFRIIELFQDWSTAALRDTRLFRNFFDTKGTLLQQIPEAEMAIVSPTQASSYQAIFQIKLNLINSDLNQFETDLDKITGQQSEIFFKRFLGPSLKVKLKVTNNIQSLANTQSFLGKQAQDASQGLTLDYQTALIDQTSRNNIYSNKMVDIKDRIVARDTYKGNIQQLASVGTPIPQVFVSASLTNDEKATWQNIAATNTANNTGKVTAVPPGTPVDNKVRAVVNPYLSLHAKLDGRGARDAHEQYLLKSNGIIVGDIGVIDGVRVDGVDINEHTHSGHDGSKPISGFNIVDGSLPDSAISTDPPPIPTDFKLELFQSKVLPPGVISIDATLSWQGNIFHTYEIQMVKDQ